MNTFSTVEELIQILDENPELLEALRSRILTEELLNLPQAHAEFVAEMRGFVARMNDFVESMNDFVETSDRNFQRLSNDFGNFRGAYAETAVEKNSIVIVMDLSEATGLGLDELTARNLKQKDLVAVARHSGDTSDLSRGELRSFYQSDLVIEATDVNGETHYIAVEASYTCNGRDTTRAIAHARLLKRFTGLPAHPVVACVRGDIGIQPDIDDAKVFWHQIDEDQLKP
ncbi:MAG: hypothetical protein OXC95_02680 [Dehalococcoidia bacterium]|nr:hypothetical protein [Dehalococcoidia bacterium]